MLLETYGKGLGGSATGFHNLKTLIYKKALAFIHSFEVQRHSYFPSVVYPFLVSHYLMGSTIVVQNVNLGS